MLKKFDTFPMSRIYCSFFYFFRINSLFSYSLIGTLKDSTRFLYLDIKFASWVYEYLYEYFSDLNIEYCIENH